MPLCWYCGTNEGITRDHKTPLSQHGSRGWDNIAITCFDCNQAKGNLTIEEWKAVLSIRYKNSLNIRFAYAFNPILFYGETQAGAEEHKNYTKAWFDAYTRNLHISKHKTASIGE